MNLMSVIQLRLLKPQKTATGKPSVTSEKSAEDTNIWVKKKRHTIRLHLSLIERAAPKKLEFWGAAHII